MPSIATVGRIGNAEGERKIVLEDLYVQRKWLGFFGGAVHGRKDFAAESAAVALSPEYSDADVSLVWKAADFSAKHLLAEVVNLDFSSITELRCPLIIFNGRHDYNVSSTVTAEWFERVKAPSKALVWFEHSGHEMMNEEPGRMLVALVQHARAAAVAVQVAQSPLASDTERSEGYYIAGNARAKLGEREDAERLFRAAVDADSKNAKALMNLGVLLYSSDRESEGISSLMLAAKRANDDPRLLIRIADVLDATGRTEMALPMRKRTVELLPAEPDAHIVYARALMNARMIEEAAAELQRAVELAPENGYAHVSLAQVLLLSERFDEAEAHAKRARELGQTEAEGVITQVEEWRALSSQGSSRPR
ncbi:MAG: tetratricopeptide repeat protein [Acidobacteria bacterium]|nr:tetratricopeptide repeat protein [Acidobacteriota bacterium]